jgi:hypothetical protein
MFAPTVLMAHIVWLHRVVDPVQVSDVYSFFITLKEEVQKVMVPMVLVHLSQSDVMD